MEAGTQRDGEPDCLRRYLQEVARIPALSAVDELHLARRAARGDEQARRHLVVAHLGLVVRIATRYARAGIPLCDLIQEGNLGLLEAVSRFDPRRRTRLKTYATFWIRDAILRALTEHSHPVHLTRHAFREFRQLTRTADQLAGRLARAPTLSQLATAAKATPARTARILASAAFGLPLDGPADGDAAHPLSDDIPCPCRCDPQEQLSDDDERGRLLDAVRALPDARQRWIIVHYYGLDGCVPHKLADLGQQLGVSLERVRQLRDRALRTLRVALADPHLPAPPAGQATRLQPTAR
jgi:RNA polymerase sigma factor (sigma-70 family)